MPGPTIHTIGLRRPQNTLRKQLLVCIHNLFLGHFQSCECPWRPVKCVMGTAQPKRIFQKLQRLCSMIGSMDSPPTAQRTRWLVMLEILGSAGLDQQSPKWRRPWQRLSLPFCKGQGDLWCSREAPGSCFLDLRSLPGQGSTLTPPLTLSSWS